MLLIPVLDVFANFGQTLDPVEVTFMRFIVQTMLMAPLVIWTRQWHVPNGTLGMRLLGRLTGHRNSLFFCRPSPFANGGGNFYLFCSTTNPYSLIGSFPRRTDSPTPYYCHYHWFAWCCYHFTPSLVTLEFLFPLGSALTMAGYVTITRQLAGKAHPYQMQFIVGFTARCFWDYNAYWTDF